MENRHEANHFLIERAGDVSSYPSLLDLFDALEDGEADAVILTAYRGTASLSGELSERRLRMRIPVQMLLDLASESVNNESRSIDS